MYGFFPQVPLFKNTALGIKRMLSMHFEQKTYFPGQLLFRENDIGHSLYYVQTGEVQVRNDALKNKLMTHKYCSLVTPSLTCDAI